MRNKEIKVNIPKENNFLRNKALRKSIRQDFKQLKRVNCRYCTAEDCSACIKQFGQAKIKQLELQDGKSEYIQDFDLSKQPTADKIAKELLEAKKQPTADKIAKELLEAKKPPTTDKVEKEQSEDKKE